MRKLWMPFLLSTLVAALSFGLVRADLGFTEFSVFGSVVSRIDGQGYRIVAGAPGALTAATMTQENPGLMRTFVSSYTFTTAQVNTALGAGTTGDITVATLPAKTVVRNAYVVITEAAAGPNTLTISCGDAIAGTPFINYIVASDAKAVANTVYGDAAAERGTSLDVEFYNLPSYTATTLVTCHFIAGNTTDLTTGQGRIVLETYQIP